MSSASPSAVDVDVDVVRRTNNLDALRLLAALGVIVGHGHILIGAPGQVPSVLGIATHYFGVSIFFAISGWLITGSWERSRSVPLYVTSRALRIVPLLWLVVLVSVLVLGPLATTLPLGEYLRSGGTWRYLVNLVFLPADGLPGVFDGVPYPGVVNGSVWTLRAEVVCYGVVLALGLVRRRSLQTAGFAAFALVAVVLVEVGDVRLVGSSLSGAGTTWVYFAVAALMRLHLPRRWLRLDVAAGVTAAWVLVYAVGGGTASGRFSWVALPYLVLAVGLASWPGVRRAARFGDLSYGTYLWAFPVQQVLVQTIGPLPLVVDVLLVASICAVLSYGTWHVLEHPALRLRNRWFAPAADQLGTPPTVPGGSSPFAICAKKPGVASGSKSTVEPTPPGR